MKNNKYSPVIGLEVHVELKTKSKMFCGCGTDFFGLAPNTHTCPVCLGLPGALPVPNRTAVDWCVMIGLALDCEIPPVSKFDRKNYFYPDLAKGYQISQYDQPFAQNGYIILSNNKRIAVRRAHMEEDTGKLLHETINGEPVSLIDFNRSGVPLVEIVTEPDFESAEEVREYLQKLQQIVRYLGVSNADMEKGEMRLEPNISLREITENGKLKTKNKIELPKYKVEVKNINSFKFVEKAINYELNRQEKILEAGETPAQETRGWDENKQKTFSQRSKEEAQDYRYFPEPDIPPIEWSEGQISRLKSLVPELPVQKLRRFEANYGLPAYDAEILTREIVMADYFEETVKCYELRQKNYNNLDPKAIANWIINKKVSANSVSPSDLLTQVSAAKTTVSVDSEELKKIIVKVLAENEKAVEDFKKGKHASLMFLLGMVMRAIGKKVDTNLVKGKIEEALKSK
jgi:aspartyl-tRNA(Asn)/glutamyl-tRNA(Gln) amidotransferase subunit B